MDYPIGEKFKVNGIWFQIDCTVNRNTGYYNDDTYTLFCISDMKTICSRGKWNTIEEKIRQRVWKEIGGEKR